MSTNKFPQQALIYREKKRHMLTFGPPFFLMTIHAPDVTVFIV